MGKTAKIISLPFPKGKVIQEIQRIAVEESGKVFFLDHAEMRMVEREITTRHIFKVLRHADTISDPKWITKEERGWRCVFKRITAGKSVEAVVKLVERDGNCCLIITVY